MSSFYNTEEQKMKAYKANLKKEAANQFKQGEKLQEYLLYEKGIETSERGLDRFAEAIGEKVGENVGTVGKLDKTKQIKKVSFDPTAIAEVDESGVSIKRKSAKQPKSIAQPPKPKTMKSIDIPAENEMMGREDVNMNTLMKDIKSKPATDDDRKTQAERQAELDLIALFQQDVKEGRKREAMRDLAQLKADEDRRIRQVFMNVLDDMMDEVNEKGAKAKAKKEYEEQKLLIDKMMNLIENQRLHDSFLEFKDIAMKDAFASKIQRNLKAALENKKVMGEVKKAAKQSRINKARDRVIDSQVSKTMNDMLNQVEANAAQDMKRNKAATTIQQRMAELRARKASKRDRLISGVSTASIDSDETDIGSLAGVSLRGRPPKFQKEELLTEAMRTKDQADSLSQKLFEREGVKSNGTPIYKIRGEERKKLAKKIDNLYSRANRLYNQHMS